LALGWLRRYWFALALALVVIVPALLWVRYLLSAGYVANAAINALERRDAARLVSLASKRECELLNLTPESVAAFLRETWQYQGRDRSIQLNDQRPHYQDVILFHGLCRPRDDPGKPRFFLLVVYQDRSGRWRLALSKMLAFLVSSCGVIPEGADPRPKWAAIAQSAGIAGVVSPDENHRVVWSATGQDDPRPFVLTREP
jgi:hypothetical protein